MAPRLPPPKAADEEELPPWQNEPTDVNSLQDRYNVETKIVGREAGTTLFVVQARDRNGKLDACPGTHHSIYYFLCFLKV